MEPEQTRRSAVLSPKIDLPLGRLLITPAAQAVLTQEDILTALNRHVRGDWGVVGPEDKAENDLSLKQGFRILSAYESSGGENTPMPNCPGSTARMPPPTPLLAGRPTR